ncbi:hypothetical protein GQ54DRAFT_339488 [Martensiomyces pterosporus]|nr:hypothetical protein GQ54DRAFT_339488 [Martensiomyces pterosporus]
MDIPMPPLPDWETDFEPRETCDSRLPYLEFTGAFELSASETRQYRLLRLPNNLTVVCVHDADATTAVASLSVNVGGYDEPRELPGLAHFCEHLLLMSSEKYPGEDEYRSYISDHGGHCNACTDIASTCYYFSIRSDALEGALDRFSQFFISPRFDADCVDREVRAVDSEFKGYLQSDGRRRHEIFKATSSPNHPFSLFNVGNLETLKVAAEKRGVDLREELIKYYNARYSADIMNLAIVSRHSLDQMTEWAAAMFSPIVSKGDTRSRIEGHPLTADELGTVVRYKTINDVYNINLEFAFPDMKPMETSGPLSYIYALLNGAGRGSILVLIEYFYSATLAGLDFSISLTDDGTYVRVSGFSDKLQKLLGLILRPLKSFKADKARFDYYLESMKQYYQNLKNSEPESIAGWDMYYLNITPSRHYSDILAELDSITIEKLQSFDDHLFDKTRIKMSMVGNFAEEDALATIGSVVNVVKCTPLPEYLRAAAELLEFWDSYLNAGTAPGLTDVACQVWSTKIPRPSDAELRNYPETSIALFGCQGHRCRGSQRKACRKHCRQTRRVTQVLLLSPAPPFIFNSLPCFTALTMLDLLCWL